MKDGTQKLCEILYGKCGKEEVKKYLGGSNAQMLHDAADKIDELKQEIGHLKEEKEIYFNRLVELGDTSENKNTTPHIAWYCKACGGITTETEIPVTMCGYCNSKRMKSYKSEE